MKTLNEAIEGFSMEALDGRDAKRFSRYLPIERWDEIDLEPKEDADLSEYEPKEFTRENIISDMKDDVAFGFKKALNKRGLSSAFMYSCVKMWLRFLEDELAEMEEYKAYGLPLFKAVALKYGFENPIGEDVGDEEKYLEASLRSS